MFTFFEYICPYLDNKNMYLHVLLFLLPVYQIIQNISLFYHSKSTKWINSLNGRTLLYNVPDFQKHQQSLYFL